VKKAKKKIDKMQVPETKAGPAVIQYGGHNASFHADLIRVGNCVVVRASDSLDKRGVLTRPARDCTHYLSDYPGQVFWRPDLGVFVVPHKNLTLIKDGN
jgi:hypothetical protein